MNRRRNLRGPIPQQQGRKQSRGPMPPQSRTPASGYSWYHRSCPYWCYDDYDWYGYDWYDYEDYEYDDYVYDDFGYDYTWDENYLSLATQKAFKAGLKMGMKKARMMWDKPEPEPMPPEPPMEQKKGE